MLTFCISASTGHAYTRWANVQTYTEDMYGLMGSVREALTNGIFYEDDLETAIKALYDFTAEELTRNSTHGISVRGGVVGMDIYYARRAVEAEDQRIIEEEARALLNPTTGMSLGTLVFSGKTPMRNCLVLSINGAIEFLGTQGNRRRQFRSSCLAILQAKGKAETRAKASRTVHNLEE